jgi:NUMOD3 motif
MRFVICKICGRKRKIKLGLVGKAKYCGRECYYKSQIGKRPHSYSKEFRRKIGLSSSLRNSGSGNPMFGKRHKKQTKQKISEKAKLRIGNLNGFFGKHHTEKAKEKISPSKEHRKIISLCCIDRIKKYGTFSKKFIQGKFYSNKNKRKLFYDSFLELQAYFLLEQMSEVVSYSRCDFYVEYPWENNIHRYLPDIKVVYKSGNIDIIEIKPLNILLKDKKVRAKGKACDRYCKQNNMNYVVWTDKLLSYNRRDLESI